MPPVLLLGFIVGDVLFVAGGLAFVLSGARDLTTLIPLVFAIPIQTLAVLGYALAAYCRPLVTGMTAVSLLGLAVGLAQPVMKLFSGQTADWTLGLLAQVATAIGCAIVFGAGLLFLLGSHHEGFQAEETTASSAGGSAQQ